MRNNVVLSHQCFVKDLTKVPKPLCQLAENMKEITECNGSLNTVRTPNYCTSTSISRFPESIWSRHGCKQPRYVGATLSQVQDNGKEHVVAYASRVLSKVEKQHCITKRSCPKQSTTSATLIHTFSGDTLWLNMDNEVGF